MKRFRAVIFDMDDTLYPEREYVLSGFKAVSNWMQEDMGFSARNSFRELREIFDKGLRGKIFDCWLELHDLDSNNLVPKLVKIYREHCPRLRTFPEIPQLLSKLKKEYLLGLVSDGYLQVQRKKLNVLNLRGYFDAVVFSDLWGREFWKPNTRPFKRILDQLQCDASQAVYVADNPIKDFIGPRQLGMFTIRYRWDGGENANREPLTPEHAPHVEIRSLAKIRNVISSDS